MFCHRGHISDVLEGGKFYKLLFDGEALLRKSGKEWRHLVKNQTKLSDEPTKKIQDQPEEPKKLKNDAVIKKRRRKWSKLKSKNSPIKKVDCEEKSKCLKSKAEATKVVQGILDDIVWSAVTIGCRQEPKAIISSILSDVFATLPIDKKLSRLNKRQPEDLFKLGRFLIF